MTHDVIDLEQARHSPRVARKRARRIREILREALAMLRDEGTDSLSLSGLATRLGLTTGALYRYFPSKDALDAELQRAVIAALVAAVRERTEDADAYAEHAGLHDHERALLAIVVTALVFERFAETSPSEYGYLSRNLGAPEFTLPDREAAEVFEAAWSALSDLAARIELAQQCDALAKGDANERAVMLWAALQGVVQTRKLARSAGGRIEPSKLGCALITSILVGWGVSHEGAGRVLELAEREGFAENLTTTLEFLGIRTSQAD